MKLDILAIGAHPDDIELNCSGTLLKHIALGKKCGILDLTLGELGTRGDEKIRKKESDLATKILGISARENIKLKDGFFENNQSSILKIIQILRKYRPEIIFANAIYDRHPDHGRAAKLISDACFYSGLMKVKTKNNNKNQDAWRPKVVYHYIQDRYIKPDFVVDITPYIEKKMQAIQAYKSQFFLSNSKEPQTPISVKNYFDFVKSTMVVMGRPLGYEYAEGFTVERTIGVKNLFDLE